MKNFNKNYYALLLILAFNNSALFASDHSSDEVIETNPTIKIPHRSSYFERFKQAGSNFLNTELFQETTTQKNARKTAKQERRKQNFAQFNDSYKNIFTPQTTLAMPVTDSEYSDKESDEEVEGTITSNGFNQAPTACSKQKTTLRTMLTDTAASATIAFAAAKAAHELLPEKMRTPKVVGATAAGTFLVTLATQLPFSEEATITDASKNRAILEQLFKKIKEVDEKIAHIKGTNEYFAKLLHNKHECTLECNAKCATNAPLTQMDLTLDAQSIAHLSLLKTERIECLKSLRNFYKQNKTFIYAIKEEENALDNISDSEEEEENKTRIQTKKILKKQIRHTNKICDTAYNKLDEPNKKQVPITIQALTMQQQAHAQEIQNSHQPSEYLAMAGQAISAAVGAVTTAAAHKFLS